jgi:glycosyltransferase involved in cell wall biosynthesis
MNKPHILVFAIDWIPESGDIASGGGLRSLQVVEALRAGGYNVTAAVPRKARTVRALELSDPARVRQAELFEENDQITLLRRHKPDLAVWLWPSARRVAFSGFPEMAQLCDLNGLQDYEFIMGVPKLLTHARRLLAESTQGADAVLTGAPEQYGYWLGQLPDGPGKPSFALAPYALPESLRTAPVTGVAALTRLHVIGNIYAWNAALPLLARAAAWTSGREGLSLRIIGGIDPGGATPLHDIAALSALEAPQVVRLAEMSFATAMAEFGPGSLSVDLNGPGTERALAVPIRTVNAITHGVPVLTTTDSPFTRRLRDAGAAWIASPEPGGLERALDEVAALSAEDFAAHGAAARAFAEAEFSATRVGERICAAAAQALHHRRELIAGWHAPAASLPPLGHILVISGEKQNMRDLRVDLPLSVLQRRKLISGYSVWHDGEIVFSSRREANPVFDAIWVQRCISPQVALLLENMALPFVYDIDDNLLVSPTYRDPFPPENMQAARNFVRRAAVLSCSTAGIATILQFYTDIPLLHKTVVAQNLVRNAPAARPAGPPTCLVWASSDTPALTDSRLGILKAVRDFCLAHKLRLVCIGNTPPALLLESGIEVEHAGMLPYQSYIEMLRSLSPAIMVCPLESTSDRATQDFVNAKSDIKILEALATGAVAVCSASRPYLETDLPAPIVCTNDYRSWFEGLSKARDACLAGAPAPAISSWRLASALGTLPFHQALLRARLAEPLSLGEFSDRLRLLSCRLDPGMADPDEFDETYYLDHNPDVREAVASGEYVSGYGHYVDRGFGEGRMAHANDVRSTNARQWWANLTNSLNDLRVAVDNRQHRIETLKARRADRLRLREG